MQKHPKTGHIPLCIRRLMILLSSPSPSHPRSGFFLHHFQTHRLHMFLPYCHSPAEGIPVAGDCRDGQSLPSGNGTGPWLGSSLSNSAPSIQKSGYSTASAKKEDNLGPKRQKHCKTTSLHPRNCQDSI